MENNGVSPNLFVKRYPPQHAESTPKSPPSLQVAKRRLANAIYSEQILNILKDQSLVEDRRKEAAES